MIKKLPTRKQASLTDQARALSVEDLANNSADFFTIAKPATSSFRILCLAGAALFTTAIAGGLAYNWTAGSTLDQAASDTTAPVTTASVTTAAQASTKSDFNSEIAKVISSSPMQPLSVAYIGGQYSGDPSSSSDLSYPAPSSDALAYSEPTVLDNSFELASLPEGTNSTSVTMTLPAEPIDEEIVLNSGDTLLERLVNLGVTLQSARAVAAAIEPIYPGKLIKEGQRYTITLDKERDFYGNEVIAPVRVSFVPAGGEEIVIESDEDGRYIATIDGKQAKPKQIASDSPFFRARAKISSSVYTAARDSGVPINVVNAALKVLGHNLDLQRQVHSGDTIDLFYGVPFSGSSAKRKVLHYAKLRSAGRDHIYYRFTDSNGKTAYYDEKGIGASKSLMATPISGGRITSGFGMRRHPLLGYNKLHTGIDFGAARGTPILSAGDGVVTHAGWHGAYGRTVIIKHGDGKYSTLYAHMSKTAKLNKGQKVRQGQVIGYVGTTGRSTGPHLHYEIRKNDRPVNPRRVAIAQTNRLSGPDLVAFKRQKNKIAELMDKAPSSVQIAQASAQ